MLHFGLLLPAGTWRLYIVLIAAIRTGSFGAQLGSTATLYGFRVRTDARVIGLEYVTSLTSSSQQ